MTATLTQDDVDTEVANLTAMLEGEPQCMVQGILHIIMWFRVWDVEQCTNSARWICKLDCGHPGVCCDQHAPQISEHGTICQCTVMTPGKHIRWLPL